MNEFNPFGLLAHAPQFVSGFFEAKQEGEKRVKVSEALEIDRLFTIGSCIPVVSTAIGTARIFYGAVIISCSLCELVNKIAVKKFTDKTTLSEKLSVLKGGVIPLFLKGVEHISMGLATQGSLMGNITAIMYEIFIRPNLPASVSYDVTCDPDCFKKLLERVKKHSLVAKVEANMQELKSLLFAS
jgi:hypothetical protein